MHKLQNKKMSAIFFHEMRVKMRERYIAPKASRGRNCPRNFHKTIKKQISPPLEKLRSDQVSTQDFFRCSFLQQKCLEGNRLLAQLGRGNFLLGQC